MASTDARVWGIGHTPHIRCTITGAVSGALPVTILSNPLTGVILKYLPLVTIPSSSTSMTNSACPSCREVGEITTLSLKRITSCFYKNISILLISSNIISFSLKDKVKSINIIRKIIFIVTKMNKLTCPAILVQL